MKAIVYHRYGAPEVLRLEDVARPNPRDGEALVRIVAASVNPGDWYLLRGVPLLLRLGSGVRKPRKQILGLAFAGRIDTVPGEPTSLRPGDEVYGETPGGGFADYLVVPQAALAPKPVNLTFEQAAAVPLVGTTALQALRDVGRLQAGQRVLITGA
jgi:NADPH:quinone reductase-like Zn-dependent oxidoreductase